MKLHNNASLHWIEAESARAARAGKLESMTPYEDSQYIDPAADKDFPPNETLVTELQTVTKLLPLMDALKEGHSLRYGRVSTHVQGGRWFTREDGGGVRLSRTAARAAAVFHAMAVHSDNG